MNLYTSFVNLDHRQDRLAHMNEQFARVGITAERTRGMKPDEVIYDKPYRLDTMRLRTPGAIGCHFSQISIWKKAQEQGKDACVFEDDLIFCSDFKERLEYIGKFTETHTWDVIWLGATFHVNPPFWHKMGLSAMAPNCSSQMGCDAKRTDDPRMIRTYGAFSTHAYIVNNKSIDKILALFERHLHESIGIDWLFIKLQPQLHCYSFVPGACAQMDNQSDIGNGITRWSGFYQLNGTRENSAYVWQDKMEDFDPDKFQWYEAGR